MRSGARDLTRALIVGAGDSGEALLREMLRMPSVRYEVVGFVDDRALPQHARIARRGDSGPRRQHKGNLRTP